MKNIIIDVIDYVNRIFGEPARSFSETACSALKTVIGDRSESVEK